MSVSKPSWFPRLILTVFLTVAIVMLAVAAVSAIGALRWPAKPRRRARLVDFAIRDKRRMVRCIAGLWWHSLCRTAAGAR